MGEKQFLNLSENKELIEAIQRKEQILGNILTEDEIEWHLKKICRLVFAAIKNIETTKGHDPYKHGLDLIKTAKEIAKVLDCPKDKIELIGCAAYLHDIGKSMIERDILNKPSQLTFIEYKQVQKHPVIGEKIVKPLNYIGRLIRHHHERVDGRGYPGGLEGEEIPLGSRIISIIDCYNAITHHRSYYTARPKKFAINEIKRCSGLPFDAEYLKDYRLNLVKVLGNNSTKSKYKKKMLSILCKKGEFNYKTERKKSVAELEEDYLATRLRPEQQFDKNVATTFLSLIK